MIISTNSKRILFASAACAFLAASCVSTPNQSGETEETKKETSATTEKETEKPAEKKDEPANNQSSGKSDEKKPQTPATDSSDKTALLEKDDKEAKISENTPPVTPVKVKTAFEEYQEKVSGISISVVSSPKEVIKTKSFASPFSVSVTGSDGTPVSGLELTVVYPSSKSNGDVVFGETSVVSDESGHASFSAGAASFACSSSVKFYPKGDIKDEKIAKAASDLTVEIPYKVRTNLRNSGGIIAVLDYNKSGTPLLSNTLSSSKLLTSLMRLGFTGVGNSNSTINNAVVKGDKNAVYKETKALVGSRSSFVIYGTIKYNSDASGLIGEATALSLSDGSVLSKASKSVSLEGTNLDSARNAIAEYFASVFNYGL